MTHHEPNAARASEPDEFGVLDIVRILLANKVSILVWALACAIVAALIVLIVRPSYTASATFLPPGSSASGSSLLLRELGSLGGLGGMGSSLGGLKDPGLLYIGILQSRTVADDLIHKFDLEKVYKTTKLSRTEKALARHTKFIPGKDTLVTIRVEDHDPKRARDLANAYLDELQKQNDRLALTQAAQKGAFFQQQLERQKGLLADAEAKLAQTEEQTGLIQPGGQAEIQIATIAATKAAIASREIELSALRDAATDQNPNVIRLRSEIARLKKQMEEMQNAKNPAKPGNVLIPTSKVPQLTLSYVRQERDVKYQEALYQFLFQQLESAKLDESESAPLVQVVDQAVTPDVRSWPPRTMLVVIAFVLGLFLGTIWALTKEGLSRMTRDPANFQKVNAIRSAAAFKRKKPMAP